jgi:mannan endo-1,4-beta-mannosidase
MKKKLAIALVAVTALVGAIGAATASIASAKPDPGPFVGRSETGLILGSDSFRFAGTNNYYLFYQSHLMVDDVLQRAVAAKFTVVRTWGWSDIGTLDGGNSVGNKPNGVYFQYWNGTGPAYNDGADGLAHLDYEIAQAGRLGLKLIIPFTNNWSDFGGMDQYVAWAGLGHHDDFYTDPAIRGWYQAYVSHLLNHVNSLTGIAYKDDPTIMAWELANEPRCVGSGRYPASATCATSTLTSWADTMSTYVRSVDSHHLIGVGDEGFSCTDATSTDWTTNCSQGVDSLALTALPNVDYMSYHLYPQSWGKDTAWGADWITQHDRDAKKLKKPAILGEFGSSDKASRNPVYQQWTDAFLRSGGDGILYWMLAGKQDDGSLYPDYDGYTVYCPSPVCQTLSNVSTQLTTNEVHFPPVADNDTVTTAFNTPVTLDPASNDISYISAVVPSSIDLDPTTPGQQTSLTVPGGTFTLAPDGTVTFVPVAGFHGRAVASYTITDPPGNLSNVATITVTVKPDPKATITLASFETPSLSGWASASWQTNAGTLSQESTFATDGQFGLHVDTTGGGWFGTNLSTPVDLSLKSSLKVDLHTGASAGTSVDIAVQNSSAWTWCQGTFAWVNAGTTTTFTADLTTGFSCDGSTLTDVRAIWIYLSGGASVDLDYVRAE